MAFKHINISDCKTLLSGKTQATILDIRDPLSFEKGHIPDAIHLESLPFATFIAQHHKQDPLIICCYHGNSSQQAAAYFTEQGFSDVYSLDGGFEAWALADSPT